MTVYLVMDRMSVAALVVLQSPALAGGAGVLRKVPSRVRLNVLGDQALRTVVRRRGVGSSAGNPLSGGGQQAAGQSCAERGAELGPGT
jgi:hypothetical protein